MPKRIPRPEVESRLVDSGDIVKLPTDSRELLAECQQMSV